MASSIFFNGRTTSTPSSQTKIDVSGLALLGLSSTGIVGCVGEARGGAPYTAAAAERIHNVTNSARALDTFKDGDLREATSFLFSPSADPDIPGGAQAVKYVKVNPATKGTLVLSNDDGDVLLFESLDWGVESTQISVQLETGTDSGTKKYTITGPDPAGSGETISEVYDNIGSAELLSLLYTPDTLGADSMGISLDPVAGLVASFQVQGPGEQSSYGGALALGPGLIAQMTNPITATAKVKVVSSSTSDVAFMVTVIGVTAGNSPETEDIPCNGTTSHTGHTSWNAIHAVVSADAPVGTITVSDATDSDVLCTLTSGTHVKGAYSFSANPLENDNTPFTAILSGAGTTQFMIVGLDKDGETQIERNAFTGAVAVASANDWSQVQYVCLGLVSGSVTVTIEGLFWQSGDRVRVVSSSASDNSARTLTVYGLDEDLEPQVEVLTMSGVTPVSGVATWSKILGVHLSAAAVGTITVSNPGATLTAFTIAPAATETGMILIENLAVHGTTITAGATSNGTSTLPVVIVGLGSGGQVQLEKINMDGNNDVPGTALWSRLTAVAVGHSPVGSNFTFAGDSARLDPVGYPTLAHVQEYFAALAFVGWTVDADADTLDTLLIDLDVLEQTTVSGVEVVLHGNAAVAAAAMEASALVSVSAAEGATGEPDNTSGALFLAGGVEGTTLFADWQAALDLLRDEYVNTVVVLTDDAAVHAATKAHCVYMAGQGGQERDCKLGAASGTSLSDGQDAVVALNTRHATMCIQDVSRFDTDGIQTQFPPYFTACLAAGMQAGASVGTSLTFKYVDVIDVVGDDSSYNVREDSDELINSGLLMLLRQDGVGFKWLRNVTTYLIDDNPAFVEAAVNQAVNYIAYTIRKRVEFAIGKKSFGGTANDILNVVLTTLHELSDQNGQFALTGWQGLVVEISGDVVRIDLQVQPVESVNFVLTTIHLTRATFQAAA